MAGLFSGIGGLVAIVLGVVYNQPELKTGGLLVLTTMTSFFIGEHNGQKTAKTE